MATTLKIVKLDWDKTLNSELLDYTRELGKIKGSYTGEFQIIDHSKKHLIIETKGPSGKLLIVFNTDTKKQSLSFEYSEALEEYFTGSEFSSTNDTYEFEYDSVSTTLYRVIQ